MAITPTLLLYVDTTILLLTTSIPSVEQAAKTDKKEVKEVKEAKAVKVVKEVMEEVDQDEEDDLTDEEEKELLSNVFKSLAGDKTFVTPKDLMNWDMVLELMGEVGHSMHLSSCRAMSIGLQGFMLSLSPCNYAIITSLSRYY